MSRTLPMIVLVTALALSGCVDRRIIITSEPSGALVHLNDSAVGRTPLEVDFTYFGTYDVRLTKEGYEPLSTSARARAPVYEWPVIDLAALAIPVTKRTVVRWHFELEEADLDEASLLERALGRRDEFEAGGLPSTRESAPKNEDEQALGDG